jgi:hypothetical protein
MTENKLCFNYGVLQGRLEALKALCTNDTVYVNKELVLSIIDLPVEEIEEEEF